MENAQTTVGDYIIRSKIDSGTSSKIYLGYNPENEKNVAIKIFKCMDYV